MLTLNDICLQITDGSHFSPEDKGIGYPMLSVKDMRDDHFDLSECKYVDEEDNDVVENMESLGELPVYHGRKWEELIDHDL